MNIYSFFVILILVCSSVNANPTHNGTNGTDLTPLNMSAGPAQLAIDNLPMMNQHSLNLRMNNGNVPDSMQNNKVDKIGGIRILSRHLGGRPEKHLANIERIHAGHFENLPAEFHFGQKFIDEANGGELTQRENKEGSVSYDADDEFDDDDEEDDYDEEESGEEHHLSHLKSQRKSFKRRNHLSPLKGQGTAKRRIRFYPNLKIFKKQSGKVRGLFRKRRTRKGQKWWQMELRK